MSNSEVIKQTNEKNPNEDSSISSSTNTSFSENIIQEINWLKSKEIYLISKNFETKIPDIFAYLQSDSNSYSNKLLIIKYLENIFTKINFNSAIFYSKISNNDKEKLNLFQVIINQYVTCPTEKMDYLTELNNIYTLLLSQVTLDKDAYHYIFSFIINFINKCNNNININENIVQSQDTNCNLNDQQLSRIMQLLQIYYQSVQTIDEPYNYFYFVNPDKENYINISNKENPKTHKKFFNLDEPLNILMYIKLLPSQIIKQVYTDIKYTLLDILFNDKSKNIAIGLDKENYLTTNFTNEKLIKLEDNKIISILVKVYFKDHVKTDIYINNKKVEITNDNIKNNKNEKKSKDKLEVNGIKLFNNFIGICSSILIFKDSEKDKKNIGLPNFLVPGRASDADLKSIQMNGFYKEELFSIFIKDELKNNIENFKELKVKKNDRLYENDIKEFYEKNLISIYMPNRFILPENQNQRTDKAASRIILKDCINNLDAEFNINSLNSSLNGIYIYEKFSDYITPFGGLNQFFPIIEIMTKNEELLFNENLLNFFNLISSFFMPSYHEILKKENDSNFFFKLSYFLEKIPDKYFDNQLACKLNSISLVLIYLGKDYSKIIEQFHHYILMNEKILFKFEYEDHVLILQQIKSFIDKSKKEGYNIDINLIINILLHYDKERYTKFCCKYHSEFFNEQCEYLTPELNILLIPMEEIIQKLFEKFIEEAGLKEKEKEQECEIGKKLFKIFELLTIDISPCIQKIIINQFHNYLELHMAKYYAFLDENKRMLDIILFIFKTSIFDIKIDALNLLLKIPACQKNMSEFYDKRSQTNSFEYEDEPSFIDNEKIIFIQNHIIPYYLLGEGILVSSSSSKKSKDDSLNNSLDMDAIEDKNKSNNGNIIKFFSSKNQIKLSKASKKLNKNNFYKRKKKNNDLDDLDDEDISKTYTFMNRISQNEQQFNYFKITSIQQKIYLNYKKKKIMILIKELYNTVVEYLKKKKEIELILNLLIKIVSKGDIALIIRFLDDLKKNIEPYDVKRVVYKNPLFLHWLLETSFQAYMIEESNFDKEKFQPGFYINPLDDDPLEEKKIFTEEETKIKIKEIFEKTNEFINNIIRENMYNLDYVLTWSKYYYEIRNNKNNYDKVINFTLKILRSSFKLSHEISISDKTINNSQKTSIYYLNILFEFLTFFKMNGEQDDASFNKNPALKYNISKIDEELYINFPYIFYLENKLEENDLFKTLSIKWKDFPFYEKIYSFFRPLWDELAEKKKKDEKDFISSFKKYIGKKNTFIYQLQLLFYSFNDIDELFNPNLTKTHGNKGIKIIYMILHFFILIINIGGNENEIKNIFNDFFLFISLMIISSHTVAISSDTKKQSWPNESQYRQVQDTIYLLFCYILNFFINKIKESDNFISKYNEKKNDDEKDLFNYYTYLRKILLKNLSYFLNFLSIFYNENKGKKFKTSKSGIYLISEKLHSFIEKKDSDNNNKSENDNNNEINFFERISKISIKRDSKEINSEIESYIYLFVNSTKIKEFLSEYLKKNKKNLYPFGEYIEKREKLIHSIIPIYRINTFNTSTNLYLSPDYCQESKYNNILDSKIGKINKELIKEILINQKKISLEENEKILEYKMNKKQLFSFRGLWSKEEYFYDQKYHLKYKLVNHLSEDFTKVLLRPIFDLDYYLPKYSQFEHENLFRIPEKQIPIYYLVDLSFALKECHKSFLNLTAKKDIKEAPANNEKQNNKNENENKNENKIENEEKNKIENKNEINIRKSKKKRNNALFDVKLANYSFHHSVNSDMTLEQTFTESLLFSEIIQQKHLSNLTKHHIKVEACLVKTELHISGIFYNNDKQIGFYSLEKNHSNDDEDYDFDRKVCFGSIFRPQTNKYNYYYINIPYDSIDFVLKKRYYFKMSVLEIFTINKKSYFFKFEENQLKTIIDNIRYYMKSNIEDIYVENVKNEIGFYNKKKMLNNGIQLPNKMKYMNLKYLYEKWTKWEISTLKMLMIINFYANRSFNDINQYPVFPWIITYYNSEEIPPPQENKIRPLGTPMGMLDSPEEAKERKESFLSTWALIENQNDDEDFDRYRSHYSTSLYITYYMVRVFPFSSMRIELQGKNFDDPNRLFNSISESFYCALTQKSDVRELIPEFFFFPEMFYNINKLNLGEIKNRETKTEEPVNDIKMPKWSNEDGFIFISKHRVLLESSEVNEKMNEWFNIIFGSKQKGSAAKKIGNLFIRQTYENFYEIYNKSEKKDKIYFCRMVEFGVTPHQIFKYDTYKRMNYNDLKSKKNIFENITEIIKKNEDKNLEISKEILVEQNNKNSDSYPIKIFLLQKNGEEEEKRKIFILRDNGIIKTIKISQQDQLASNKKILSSKNVNIDLNEDRIIIEKKISKKLPKISDSQKDINLFLPKYRMDFKESPNLFFNKGHSIALGGYWNGNILVENISIQNKKEKNNGINTKIYSTKEYSPITHMIIDENETFVICGNNLGTVFIYTMDYDDKTIWHLYKILYDHFNPITSLAISEKLNIFISCSKYGYFMLYTLPKCKLINSHNLKNIINNNLNGGENMTNINLFSDITLISDSPLPCIIFYVKSRNSLCVSSINGHFICESNRFDFIIQPNTIKKFTDRHFIDYILLFNPKNESIDIYNIIDLQIVINWQIKNYTFIDFILTKEMDNIFILTKINLPKEEREKENEDEDKNIFEILVIKTNNEIKIANEKEENIEIDFNDEEEKMAINNRDIND